MKQVNLRRFSTILEWKEIKEACEKLKTYPFVDAQKETSTGGSSKRKQLSR